MTQECRGGHTHFAILCLALITDAAFTQPRLSPGRSTVELGTIYQGEVKSVSIPVRNTGTATLIIQDVSTSCGCTTVKNVQKELAPGGGTEIAVEVNTAGLQGELKKQVIIQSNDPLSPSTLIVLKLSVKTELEPVDRQYSLWLGNVTVGRTEKRRITYRNVSSHPLGIAGGSSGSPDMTIAVAAGTLQPDQVGSADIAVTPSHEGYTRSDFRISITGSRQRSLAISVTYIGVRSE